MFLTTLHKLALLITVPVTGILLYILYHKVDEEDEKYEFEKIKDKVVTASHTLIEVKVPGNVVGKVIGPRGSVIKHIQEITGARVNFKDEVFGDTNRIAIIRGTGDTAQQAELEIRKIIAEQPTILVEEILVPQKVVGRIIGKGGETIRCLNRLSGAKINIDRDNAVRPDNKKTVKLQGTYDAINHAKELIAEKIDEENVFQARMTVSASNRTERNVMNKSENNQSSHEVQSSSEDQVQDGISNEYWPKHSDFFEIFVSSVASPDCFYVQIITSKSPLLDSLITDMTRYYSKSNDQLLFDVKIGDYVAAPFQLDSSWYRARITDILDDGKLDLYYIDFGDYGTYDIEDVRSLRADFLSLPHQAFCCSLANVAPIGKTWTEEAISTFVDLCHAAKWKLLSAKTLGYNIEGNDTIPALQLIDTYGDVDIDIGEELVSEGYARKVSSLDQKQKSNGITNTHNVHIEETHSKATEEICQSSFIGSNMLNFQQQKNKSKKKSLEYIDFETSFSDSLPVYDVEYIDIKYSNEMNKTPPLIFNVSMCYVITYAEKVYLYYDLTTTCSALWVITSGDALYEEMHTEINTSLSCPKFQRIRAKIIDEFTDLWSFELSISSCVPEYSAYRITEKVKNQNYCENGTHNIDRSPEGVLFMFSDDAIKEHLESPDYPSSSYRHRNRRNRKFRRKRPLHLLNFESDENSNNFSSSCNNSYFNSSGEDIDLRDQFSKNDYLNTEISEENLSSRNDSLNYVCDSRIGLDAENYYLNGNLESNYEIDDNPKLIFCLNDDSDGSALTCIPPSIEVTHDDIQNSLQLDVSSNISRNLSPLSMPLTHSSSFSNRSIHSIIEEEENLSSSESMS